MQESTPRWSLPIKLTVVLLLLGLAIYLLYRFRAVITPLVLAIILAYVVSPLVNFFEGRLRLRRGLAILAAYLALLILLVATPMLLIPPLAAQTANLNLDLRRYLTQIEELLAYRTTIAGQTLDVQVALEQVIGSVQGLIEPVFTRTLEFAIEAISSLVWVVFILIVSFYLVKDSQALNEWVEGLVPPTYQDDYIRLRTEISSIWAAFFRGQLMLALVVATVFTIAGFILGLPFALVMGLLAGLLEFLPSIGHGIWLVTASLLALFAGSTWMPVPNWAFMLLIIGLHIFYQQFDLNYLIPRIIGRRVHLAPLVVILGIVSGALLAGVLGIVLAAPSIASLRVLGRYIFANLIDQNPFPAVDIAHALPPPNPRWWRKSSASASVPPPIDRRSADVLHAPNTPDPPDTPAEQ
ncbi:MAG: AI-2E family transporter [Anaerolineales bacterium]|nr:AI-2E family transporter [Anaerolineales bacterium]